HIDPTTFGAVVGMATLRRFLSPTMPETTTGLDRFLAYLQAAAAQAPPGWPGSVWFMLRVGEDCAGIRTSDVARPYRFLRQMAVAPPVQFGATGFSPEFTDDGNPARHYIAFVFVGFWLPAPLAIAVLYAWEIAGFVRYGGYWSPRDVASGHLGIRHGRAVRSAGPTVLPGLAAALGEGAADSPQ
ncbi:MAG: hypothetical protein KDD91_06395, partial [Caldilinea sp.]|nr:hypothetical protein [Caldilinea sp.]